MQWSGQAAKEYDYRESSWQRIEAWLAQHAPDQIQKLEAQLGVSLPALYKESCAIHDGQKEDCDLIPDGYGTFYLFE